MNVRQLVKRIGESLRVRPKALLQDHARVDDLWQLEAVQERPAGIKLRHVPSGHTVELNSDNVREFRTPDFILLRCQLYIHSSGVHFEPLVAVGPSAPPPLSLRELMQTLREAPLAARESVERSLHGVKVCATGRLGSISALAENRLRVGVIAADDDVFCEVHQAHYPVLMVATAGTPVTVIGIFAKTVPGGIFLEEVEITL